MSTVIRISLLEMWNVRSITLVITITQKSTVTSAKLIFYAS